MIAASGWNVRIWAVAGALVVGFVLGRWAGTAFAGAGGASDVEPAVADGERSRPSTRSPSGVVTDAPLLIDRIAELQGELALHKVAKETYEYELYGEPIEWPAEAELPPEYRPDEFRRLLRAAMEDCEADLVDVECSEPPCLALIRGRDAGYNGPMGERCAGWVEQFGASSSGKHMNIDCGDGRTERVHMVTPPARDLLPDDHDDEAWANLRKRMTQRYEQIELGWECAAGG